MKFVGADLPKKRISLCVVQVVERTTQVVQRRRFACQNVSPITDFLRTLGRFGVTVEATIGYDWFAARATTSLAGKRGVRRSKAAWLRSKTRFAAS